MKLKLNKNQIITRFLAPISKITDTCSINLKADSIEALASNEDGTVILYSKYKAVNDVGAEKTIKININNTKKFVNALKIIDGDNIELELDSNSLNYDSNTVRFKYHLVEDDVIKKVPISVTKINTLKFDNSFTLTAAKLSEILKGSSFAVDSNKIYFYTKDGAVFGELTDKTNTSLDSITFYIADDYKGEELKTILPVYLEVFRTVDTKDVDIKVKINTEYKVIMLEIADSDYCLKYIVPTLVK